MPTLPVDPDSNYQPVPRVSANPLSIAVVEDMRLRDMWMISRRLGRVDQSGSADKYRNWFQLLFGTALGALVGLVQSITSDADSWLIILNVAVVLGMLGGAGLCRLAYRDVEVVRSDSIAAIKEDLDEMLSAYPSAIEVGSADEPIIP